MTRFKVRSVYFSGFVTLLTINTGLGYKGLALLSKEVSRISST